MRRPTIEEIAARLGSFEGFRSRLAVTWQDIIDMYPNHPSFGEVRTPDDWHRVPVECAVRAVYLVDDRGPVIRWLSDKAAADVARILGGFFHDDLERGDGLGRARSGYLWRRRDGTIEVRP